jgi:hypothetical protein
MANGERETEKVGERCPGKRPLPRRTAPGAIRGDHFMISHPPGSRRWSAKGKRDGSILSSPFRRVQAGDTVTATITGAKSALPTSGATSEEERGTRDGRKVARPDQTQL